MASRRLASVVAIAALASSAAALYINGSVTAPCDSPLYCQGDILKAIELASPFSDSKTFVDMPTTKPLNEVILAFNQLTQPLSNNSELNDFLAANFAPAGGELEDVPVSELKTDPVFLKKVDDGVINEFVNAVIDIWPDLTRRYAGPGNCTECANSFIPVNRTFVVAGGRFREPYYWDSYWIVEGLLRTGGAFIEISKNIIENFLDFVETIGFVPNGARVYYLNRSQPPLLSQMVRVYIEHTNDTSILERAVPLLIKEHEFWMTNRTVDITAPDGKKYTLNRQTACCRYHVQNNQPRPESYREDWISANNGSYYAQSGIIYPQKTPLNESQKADLYANLASGAESGWDYGTRYLARPNDAALDVYFPLRSLNVVNIVPVDLNSILYQNEVAIGNFLKATGNDTGAKTWAAKANVRSQAMYALMWNSTLWSYFDYNLTSNSQNIYIPLDPDTTPAEEATAPKGYQVLFDIAQLYPFWTGAAPEQLKNNPLAVQQAYSRVETMLDVKAGGIPATNLQTGQQWDEPNVWPPLQHVLMKGLLNTPATFGTADPAYVAVQDLSLRLAQRYLDSTFCTWYATGGSTSQTPKLQGLGSDAVGAIFEKYADNSTNVAGGGGEYTVVEGFGWSNGVLIWAADTFAGKLKRPDCGNITAAHVTPGKKRSVERRAIELHPRDAMWTKSFGSRAPENKNKKRN
ncbi:glycoside hydrolase family 37 protein [Lasiosphaeria ovina]|uniref:Trehalase n=1 Tax=Lasiosphaeria ovina TaxID=92902 RepID=A0AAE0NIW9_9PEZI|nr:glycoside hydrolase family 37 protein [Lasiosphaeria ovina]